MRQVDEMWLAIRQQCRIHTAATICLEIIRDEAIMPV